MDCSLFNDVLDNIRQDKFRSGAQNFTKIIPIRTKTSTSEIWLSWYKIKCRSFSKNQSRDPHIGLISTVGQGPHEEEMNKVWRNTHTSALH